MADTKIDWNNLQKERSVPITTFKLKKLPNDVFACPNCYGSGKVTIVFRDPGPNRMGTCYVCDGTGEIIKCLHPDCDEPVPNESNWYSNKLCAKHEREYIDKLVKENHVKKTI